MSPILPLERDCKLTDIARCSHTDEEVDEGGDEEGHAERDAVGDGEGDAQVAHDVVLRHEPRRQWQRRVCSLDADVIRPGVIPAWIQ